MNTNDTNRQKAHSMIDHIFKDLLPTQGMVERSEQIKLSHRMLDTMLNGGIALCDAGTGIGKTYAYLVAAAAANRSDTEALRKPVIISTSSIALQNAVQTEYLPLLSCILLADGQIDRPLFSVIRKGKGHYVCDERLQRRLRQVNFQKKDPAAADALRTLKGTLDMDNVPHLSGYDRERVCVPQFCDCDHQGCRYRRFLKRCDADRYVFQICNHNLLLADAIHRSQGKRPIFPEHSVIIVDEAHKLPEAAREMFGMTLTAGDIQSMIRQLRAERYLLAADVLTDTMGSLLRKLTQPREETEPLDAYLRLLTIPSRSLLVIEKQVGRLLSAQGRRQLEKLEITEAPKDETNQLKFRFEYDVEPWNELVLLKNLTIKIGDRTLLEPFTYTVCRGQRLIIAGPNGAGKSTLMQVLDGKRRPSGGMVRLGTGARPSIFAQQQNRIGAGRVIDVIWNKYPRMTELEVRSHLAKLGFRGETVFKPCEALSGGELARLRFAEIVLERPNLLFLDEPTNHLDIYTRENLTEALMAYTGTLLLVTHDRHLMNSLACPILYLEDGKAVIYPSYDALMGRAAPAPVAEKSSEPAKAGYGKEQRRRRAELRAKIKACEDEMEACGAREVELENEINSPEVYNDPQLLREKSDELSDLRFHQDELFAAWEAAVEEQEQYEQTAGGEE